MSCVHAHTLERCLEVDDNFDSLRLPSFNPGISMFAISKRLHALVGMKRSVTDRKSVV